MNRRNLTVTLVSLVVLVWSVGAEAAIVHLECWLSGYPSGTYDWEFDYDTQHLMVNDTIVEIPPWPELQKPPETLLVFGMKGTVDIDSRFTVTRTITNGTTVPWTSFLLLGGPMPVSLDTAGIIYDTIEVTKLQSIVRLDGQDFEFTEPPPVLPGESLTMDFEMVTFTHNGEGGAFRVGYTQYVVPEPATAVLLGIGLAGVRVLRRRTQP